MHSAALALTWLVSVAPLLLERAGWLDLAVEGPGASPRIGLVALAWLALAGAPRRAPGPVDLRASWGSVMAALPVLALACALDLGRAESAAPHVRAALWAVLFLALATLAADGARQSRAAHGVHAALWLVGALALPLLAAAETFGPRAEPSAAPAWLASLSACSPLVWSLGVARGQASPVLPLAALVAVSATVALLARRTRGTRGARGARP